jgi:hypothetical protein
MSDDGERRLALRVSFNNAAKIFLRRSAGIVPPGLL